MPEFKKDIGGTGYKPVGRTVHSSAAENASAAYQASLMAAFAEGAGTGYAEAAGKEQLGEDESAAEAAQVVADAFKGDTPEAVDGVAPAATEPTKEDMEKKKNDFLARADLNDRRLQAALDQGLIGSKEANDRRIQNRKEFASNPISAMFLEDYDRITGGGTAGAGRKAFFGKTAAEKGREQAQQQLASEAVLKRDQAEMLVRQGVADTTETGLALIEEIEGNEVELKLLQSKQKLTQAEGYRKVELSLNERFNRLSPTFINVLKTPGGATAEQKRDFALRLTAEREQARLEIDNAGLSAEDHKRAIEELDNTIAAWEKRVEDTDYATFYEERTKDLSKRAEYQKTLRWQRMVASNPALFTLFDKLPQDIATKIFDYTTDPTSLASVLFSESEMGKTLLSAMDEINRDKALLTGLDSIAGGAKTSSPTAGTEEAKATLISDIAVVEAIVEAHDDESFEGMVQSIKSEGKHLGQVVGDDKFSRLAKKHPNKALVLMKDLGKEARKANYIATDSAPSSLRVELIPGKGGNRKKITADTELSDRMVADVNAVHKAARNNPSLWNKQFEVLDDFISHLFLKDGPAAGEFKPSPLEEPGIASRMDPREVKFTGPQGAPLPSEDVLKAEVELNKRLEEKGDFTPEEKAKVKEAMKDSTLMRLFNMFTGNSEEDPVTPKAIKKEQVEEGEKDAALLEAVTDVKAVETGGEKDPFIRTRVAPSEGSTAYGPLQVTVTLASDYLDRKAHLFTPEEKDYLKRFIAQGEKFNEFGKEPDKEGYEEKYDYGGTGDLTSQEDKLLYVKTFLKVFEDRLQGDYSPENIAKKWHGGDSPELIAQYAEKLRAI